MVAARLLEDAGPVLDAAALRVVGREIDAPQPRERDGGGAHRAGFERDVEIAIDKPRRALRRRGRAQRQHLGMGRRVGELQDAVAGGGKDRALRVDDGGADRHFAARGGALGLGEGERHRAQSLGHGRAVAVSDAVVKQSGAALPSAAAELTIRAALLETPFMPQPVIGLTLDSEPPGGYSKFPWYALRENYCAAVARAGGLPVLLPHEPDRAADYLALIDGLVVTGGAFDVDPTLFGASTRHATVTTKDRRTAFELAITRGAHAAEKPVLGICGGQQLLNVALGGTLIQHIPDEVEGALAHEQPNPRSEAGHAVSVVPGTLLHRVTQMTELPVNSAHHQAVKALAPGLVVDATAPDGVIEGIEDPRRRFCLGVQWHPEFAISAGDVRIFEAFIAAAA